MRDGKLMSESSEPPDTLAPGPSQDPPRPRRRRWLALVLLLILALALALCTMAGCKEESLTLKKAKLVGNENIRLKKELEAKDNEIQKQKDLLADKDAEIARVTEEAGNATLKVMQHLAENSQKIEQLTTENQALKEKIKQLEAKLAEK